MALIGKRRTYTWLDSGANPGVNDDVDHGFHVGDLWLRTDTGKTWILQNETAGAAVWAALN